MCTSGIMKQVEEMKKAKDMGKLVVGSRSVISMIKNSEVSIVYFANNIPKSIERDLEYYKKVSGLRIEKVNMNSKKLGEVIGKPFNVLLVGIKKSE